MTIQHKDIPDGQLHEPKGISTATSNQLYVANGANSGSWQKLQVDSLDLNASDNLADGDLVSVDLSGQFVTVSPSHASAYFVDLASPYTVTYPSVYTKIAPATSLISSRDMSNGTGRLTYTGTLSKRFRFLANMSVDQTTGANRDIEFVFYKNGVALTSSTVVRTLVSGNKSSVTALGDITLATNDYVELWVKNAGASGDIRFYTFRITCFTYDRA